MAYFYFFLTYFLSGPETHPERTVNLSLKPKTLPSWVLFSEGKKESIVQVELNSYCTCLNKTDGAPGHIVSFHFYDRISVLNVVKNQINWQVLGQNLQLCVNDPEINMMADL